MSPSRFAPQNDSEREDSAAFAPTVILSEGTWYNKVGHSANDKKEVKEVPKGERKDYPKELKLAAVYMMRSGKLAPKEVFEMLGGIDRQTVYRWVHEYEEGGETAFDSKKAVLPAKELTELQKQNADLRMENEILKKASAYFAAKKTTL